MGKDIAIQTLKEKIDDLNQQAWDIRVTDSPKAFTLSQEAVKHARAIHYPPGLALALQILGFCYIRLSKYDEALPLLNESLFLFGQLNDLKGQAIVYEYQAIIQRTWGNLGGALELLYKSNDITEQNEITEIIATNHYQLGVTYKHLGDFEKALDHFYRSMEAARKIENSLFEAYSINLIGSIYFENGDYEHALDYYQQAMVFRQDAGDKLGEAGSLDNIGFTHLKLKNFEQAIDHCNQSLIISRSTDDKRGQANALLHLAEIYKQKNDIPQAAKFSHDSLEIREASGDRRGEAEIFLFLSELYKNQTGHDKDVVGWLNNTLNIAEEIKALDLLSKTRSHLYEYYKAKGNFEEALKNLDIHTQLEKEFHKNAIAQKVSNLEISHKAETISQRNKELTELNEQIEKANTELKIEASLERVRARTMAMRHSDELTEVVKLLYLEFDKLKINNESTDIEIGLIDEETGIAKVWAHFYLSDGTISTFKLPLTYIEEINNEFNIWKATPVEKRNEIFLTTVFSGDLSEKFIRITEDFPELTEIFRPLIEAKITKWVTHNAYFSHGFLTLQGTEVYSSETQEIQKRFAKVFEQTYTRFLDLQKAEEQAREAQIEAAVEKVRSRSLAMHKSEELRDVVHAVFEKLKELNVDFYTAIIILFEEGSKDVVWWLESKVYDHYQKILVPYADFSYMQDLVKTRENKNSFFTKNYSFEEKNQLFHHLFNHTELKQVPSQQKEFLFGTDFATISVAISKSTGLHITSYSRRSFSEQDNEIFKRFAKVFDQAYTRFLDLQKAEAQAREAQIETSLERVRSASMAMHSSDELHKVIRVLTDQFSNLGFHFHSANFITNESMPNWEIWISSPGVHDTPPRINVPYTDHILFNERNNAIADGKEFITASLDKEQKDQFFHYLFEKTMAKVTPHDRQQWVYQQKGMGLTTVLMKNISLSVINYDGTLYSAEENEVIKRFAKVFEQSYTRFLDLQKAEAQAREALIETGLERVRSKTMAMHKSEEVTGVAVSLNEELMKLGFEGGSTIIIINKQTGDTEQWTGFSEDRTLRSCLVPNFKHPYHDALFDAWKKDEKFLVQTIAGEEKKTLDEHYFSTGYKIFPENDKKWMRAMESVTFSYAFMKYGAIHWGPDHLTVEQLRILQRFSKVFEQSYTRFLDLKKAEAQAREAQIEVAVERVRAKALAMHRSEDMHKVVVTLKKELMGLHIPNITAATIFLEQDDGSIRILDLSDTGVEDDDKPQLKIDKVFRLEDTDPELWIRRMWNRTGNYFVLEADEADFVRVIEFVRTIDPAGAKMAEKIIREKAIKKAWLPTVKLGKGIMNIDLLEPPGPEVESILLKMGAGFDLAYKRFLDLQKAEAQAKEAQIEAALERVRSRTMAMHNSADLLQVVNVVSEQLQILGFPADAVSFITDSDEKGYNMWLSRPGDTFLSRFYIPRIDDKINKIYNEAVQNGDDYYSYVLTKEEKDIYFKNFFENTVLKQYPDEFKQPVYEAPGMAAAIALMDTITLNVSNFRAIPYTDADKSIIKRFAFVFQQSYTRFLDLKKAEAQAREAEIELALERVRARTMAMQSPTEFAEVINVIGGQFTHLGFDIEWANFGANGLDIAEGIDTWNFAVVPGADPVSSRLFIPRFNHPLFIEAAEQLANYRKTGNDLFVMTYGKEDKDLWLDHLFTKTIFKDVPEEYRAIQYAKPGYTTSNLALKDTFLSIGKFDPISFTEEQHAILRRFGNAFGLAYTRFLDLQKAEAQAREAQIEAALERVRSRTMGMQKSEELPQAANLLFQQIESLGIPVFSTGYNIWNEDKTAVTSWMSSQGIIQPPFNLPLTEESALVECYTAAQRGDTFFVQELSGEKLSSHLGYMSSLPVIGALMKKMAASGISIPDHMINHHAFFSQGYLLFISYQPVPEAHEIFKRFAKVFEQTYTRFLDLQKAEAQAREAEIELALERVRARTMAMHKSDELKEVIQVVYEQFVHLNIHTEHTGFVMDYKTTNDRNIWVASKHAVPSYLTIPYFDSEYYNSFNEAKEKGMNFFAMNLTFEEKNGFYQDLFKYIPGLPDEAKEFYFTCPALAVSTVLLDNVALYIENFEGIAYSEEENAILMRFGKVFQQTYTRFLDLKRAEAQAREALIEAALERVRARALAMQEPEELKDVAQVLRNEMGILGIEELETCSIYIHEKDSETAECWYALKDPKEEKKRMVSDHFHLELNDTWVGREMKKFYSSEEKQTSIVMQGSNRKEWIEYCYKHSPVFSGFYGETIPDRSYHLYKFSHGYIGAAAPGDISAESWRLLSRAASVFSLAYSRFKDLTQARNDLIKLKEEKKRAEDALTELQATQKQLVQSEKMASLGELTAGIAHEIQNPLNFVNNFSDVSNELLEEMKNELEKGNADEAKAIAIDVKENLEKILHHGKRADAIVKGMLQHSRSSSGQKELTDINTLAEEYIRLAYHGLRAKDKFFNAKFETDLDNSIDKINIVPQEMGRVILNLINNAFYAVNEKKKNTGNGFEPSVTISTKKINDKVEISVKDNGNGIPQKVLDKIFQPFFTTKPTGQGTGLGLSLSYDIITKGHDGEIKVETKEGEGSEFIISLPVN